MYFFTWMWMHYWFPDFLQRPHAWEKTGSWAVVQKPIEQSDYRFLYTTIEVNFLFAVSIHRNNTFVTSFQVGVDMPKVIPNHEWVSSQEWVEQ